MKTFYLILFAKMNIVFAQSQIDILKNINQFSDGELYRIARHTQDQALPGEIDYVQILLIETIRKNPKNIDAQTALNEIKKTNFTFQNAIESGNAVALKLDLGMHQYHQNKLHDAIRNLKFAIHALKDRPFVSIETIYFAHTQLARALIANKNYKEGLQELNFLARNAFQSPDNFQMLTNDLLNNGYDHFLESPLRIAIANDPMFAYPYSALADILKRQNKIEEAEEYHQKFVFLHNQ